MNPKPRWPRETKSFEPSERRETSAESIRPRINFSKLNFAEECCLRHHFKQVRPITVLTIPPLERATGVGNMEITAPSRLPPWTLCSSLSPYRYPSIWLLTLQSSLTLRLPTILRTPSRTPEATRSLLKSGCLKSLCTSFCPRSGLFSFSS